MAATDAQPADAPSAGRTFFDWTVDEPDERPTTGAPLAPDVPRRGAELARGSAALGSADYGAPRPPGAPDPERVRRVA